MFNHSCICFRVHICLTFMHTKPGVAEKFVTDIKECIVEILKNPTDKEMGKVIYGLLLLS